MFDCIIFVADSAGKTVAYHLAKRDNKGKMSILAAEDTQAL